MSVACLDTGCYGSSVVATLSYFLFVVLAESWSAPQRKLSIIMMSEVKIPPS